jgi:hypothetical protein
MKNKKMIFEDDASRRNKFLLERTKDFVLIDIYQFQSIHL